MGRALSAVVGGLVSTMAIACAVSFAPGDYAGSTAFDAAIVDAGASDGPVAVRGDASAPARRLIVIAGERDGDVDDANDVWIAPIADNGDLGAFHALRPRAHLGRPALATIAEGRLFVATSHSFERIEHAPFDGTSITAPWQVASVPPPPHEGYGMAFFGSALVAFGGRYVSGTSTVRDSVIRLSSFQPSTGSFGEFDEHAEMPFSLADMRVTTFKRFFFLIGPSEATNDSENSVYVALLHPVKGTTEFAKTTSIVDPASGEPHVPKEPTYCAAESSSGRAHMFVLGGQGVDVVLSSEIDPQTGELGAWRSTTKLPSALSLTGCASFHGALHILGGLGTERSDRILRAKVNDDGTLGPWELSYGKLPAPRSGVIGLVH